ncbi:Predicted nucleic acid-binding protein, contains Zn-ribbon domain [Halogranum amylolyticum]|uniref:Predicted nucleic acid-binding protein, contains Zn-ribbon domain n=1 Tax=Halogranum amylolyticum TaxID=660520 RepID=A0A1H8N774_9EURY|nr:hypothetical protein [Halogranum amylolyticum]SEO25420.1 Predicted nucleic acid-binding protein, contains Zn-ribbon domain [Halogranum amylolyticum]
MARAVLAYRLVEEEGETLATVDRSQERLTEAVDRLESRVGAVEDDLDAKIDDVRSRVVQVKREADAKAPADHDHPALDERVDAAGSTATEALAELDRLDERVDRGFENYEEILTYLRETTDDLDDDVDRLVRTLVDLRERTATLEATLARRTAAADLQREANRHGVTQASCGDCGSTVHLGLLSAPRCPHCDRGFTGLEPARGFFGSATLSVGDRPALAGETTDSSSTAEPRQAGDDD